MVISIIIINVRLIQLFLSQMLYIVLKRDILSLNPCNCILTIWSNLNILGSNGREKPTYEGALKRAKNWVAFNWNKCNYTFRLGYVHDAIKWWNIWLMENPSCLPPSLSSLFECVLLFVMLFGYSYMFTFTKLTCCHILLYNYFSITYIMVIQAFRIVQLCFL